MADIKQSSVELIGGTPLLQLNGYAKKNNVQDATILAKLEYLNPAGSVKDRIAKKMIEDAKKNFEEEEEILVASSETKS